MPLGSNVPQVLRQDEVEGVGVGAVKSHTSMSGEIAAPLIVSSTRSAAFLLRYLFSLSGDLVVLIRRT